MKLQQPISQSAHRHNHPLMNLVTPEFGGRREHLLGERVEQALHARGIRKIYPLALELGVNESCISRWRRGGAISTDNAIKLCKTLNISIDWLLCGRGHMDQHKIRSTSDQEYAFVEILRQIPDNTRKSILDLFTSITSQS